MYRYVHSISSRALITPWKCILFLIDRIGSYVGIAVFYLLSLLLAPLYFTLLCISSFYIKTHNKQTCNLSNTLQHTQTSLLPVERPLVKNLLERIDKTLSLGVGEGKNKVATISVNCDNVHFYCHSSNFFSMYTFKIFKLSFYVSYFCSYFF